MLSPEIEDRDEVEVGNWAKHKKTFYSEWLLYLQKDHEKKSDSNSLIFFCCSYSKMTLFKLYNFQIVDISTPRI
jgi:hypothetical protein